MDFRERYKRIGFGREDVDTNRALRSQRRDEARREVRSERFNARRRCLRNNSDDSLECPERVNENSSKKKLTDPEEEARKKAAAELEAAVQKRLLQLEKWREERNRRRIQEKKRAKPVFKVGVVHHRVYSPPLTKNPIPLPVPKLCKSKEAQPELPPKRVTRATEKRLAIKAVTNHQKRENLRSKKVPVKPKKIELQTIPLIPKDHQFKAPLGITPLPLFGRQAVEGINENMEIDLNYINVSSTNSEFFKNLSIDSTEHLFSSTTHSAILRKFANNVSNIKKLNADLCDMSVNKSFSDSLNNTSIEAVSLKISSDDQEMLSDEENVQSAYKIDSSYTKNRRSRESKMRASRNLVPDKVSTIKPVSALKHQEISENQNNIDSSLSNINKTTDTRRSARIITNEGVNSDKSVKDVNLILEDEKIINSQESFDSNYHGTNSSLNSSFSKEKKTKSLANKKRSNNISINETVNLKNVSKENNSFFENQKILDNNSDPSNASVMDSTTLDQNKVKLSRRKSARTSYNGNPSINDSAKESSFTQEMIGNEENVDLNWVNFMDSSLVNENQNKFFGRKKLKRNANQVQKHSPNSQDESLIKFSPRRSLRQRIEKSLNETSSSKVITKKSPKLSPSNPEGLSHTESLNLSSASEPTRQNILENEGDNSQNFSLNLSLVKHLTPEKPPAFFSPYIVTSRGKSSVRKEVQRQRLSQCSLTEIPTKDTVMQSLNISVDEEERTAQYYKYILNQEINRLNERCDIWNLVKKDDTTPEEIRYVIQAAVGQTTLLINKKFERFRSLVFDCETGKGEMLVTCKDLQGFWEMMYMEIKDCDNRFNKLEELRQNSWVEEETEEVKDVQKLKKKLVGAKKPIDKKKTIPTKPSSLRAHIMAARQKKIGGKDTDVDIEMIENQKTSLQKDEESRNSSTKSAVKYARRTSTPKSSNKWQPILKKLSQSQKSTTSPLIVMKLSQMCKTPEVHLDDSIVYINSGRTPAKSILKTSKDDLISFSAKSANKVFFKEQPMEFQEIETEIENNDKIDNCKEPIERKLDFESDSFNSSHAENRDKSDSTINISNPAEYNAEDNTSSRYSTSPKIVINKANPTSPISLFSTMVNNISTKYLTVPKTIMKDESPMISVSPLTLKDSKAEDSNKKATKTKKQISFKEDINESYSRTLRSRTFAVPLTPRLNLKNSMNKVDEDLSMEVDDSIQECKDDSPFPVRQQSQLKELYLNADGIISQRIVTEKKNIFSTPKLKRNNSKTPAMDLDNLITPVVEVANENKKSSSTPRVRRKSLKKLPANTELSEDNANVTVEEITKVKLNRRTSKTLNITQNNIDEIKNINESAKKNLRVNSTPIYIKSSLEINSKQVLTPSLKTRNSKRLQGNIESVLQETDLNLNENVKISRTSSLRRTSSKKSKQNFEQNEQQTGVNNTISEALTPNRRKSLRIAQIMKNED